MQGKMRVNHSHKLISGRILVWQVGGGWGFGNRFLGLLSLMLVALAEDRLIFGNTLWVLCR